MQPMSSSWIRTALVRLREKLQPDRRKLRFCLAGHTGEPLHFLDRQSDDGACPGWDRV